MDGMRLSQASRNLVLGELGWVLAGDHDPIIAQRDGLLCLTYLGILPPHGMWRASATKGNMLEKVGPVHDYLSPAGAQDARKVESQKSLGPNTGGWLSGILCVYCQCLHYLSFRPLRNLLLYLPFLSEPYKIQRLRTPSLAAAHTSARTPCPSPSMALRPALVRRHHVSYRATSICSGICGMAGIWVFPGKVCKISGRKEGRESWHKVECETFWLAVKTASQPYLLIIQPSNIEQFSI